MQERAKKELITVICSRKQENVYILSLLSKHQMMKCHVLCRIHTECRRCLPSVVLRFQSPIRRIFRNRLHSWCNGVSKLSLRGRREWWGVLRGCGLCVGGS